MSGYSVGTTILDKDKTPFPLEFSTNHIICYDIESEFAGKGYCHYGVPMLCITLVCSCGWSLCISRSKVTGVSIPVMVCKDNKSMAEQAMRSIVDHRPIFTLGHNIYPDLL